MQRLNTYHVTVHETRGLPAGAGSIVALCAGQKLKLANLAKGALVVEAGGTFVGVEAAETIWVHAYGNGLFESSLGSCMLLLTTLDLHSRPYDGWLPLVTVDGATLGRVRVTVFGDLVERITVGISRGAIADTVILEEPFIELRLRGDRKRTTSHQKTRRPEWDDRFAVYVGARDTLTVALFGDEDCKVELGCAEVPGAEVLRQKGEPMWVTLTEPRGKDSTTDTGVEVGEAARVLLSFTEEPWEQDLPVRILQVRGLATTPLERATDLRVSGKCGAQEFQTTLKPNTTDAVWDEEFLLRKVRPFDALHLLVLDKEGDTDEALGEAFVPVAELRAHGGEQVWVDLTGRGQHHGKLLVWVQPPPGSVYPDTLLRRRLVAYEDWDLLTARNAPGALAVGSRQARLPVITYVGDKPAAAVFVPETRSFVPSQTRGGYDPARDYRLRI